MHTPTLRRPLARLAPLALMVVAACTPAPAPEPGRTAEPVADAALPAVSIQSFAFDPSMRTYELTDGSLVPSTVSMISAWDIPRNPLTDSDLDDSPDAELIRTGFRLFINTPVEATRLTPSGMACGNCHLNAGQRELALPLVGAAGMFPEYNNRAGVDFTLEDRIVGCFMRSENAPGGLDAANEPQGVLPTPDAPEVVALASYIRWLGEGHEPGDNPPWRKQNRIPPDALIPVDELDPALGAVLYGGHCSSCHGTDGEGVQIGDKKAGPLWGDGSWNDGAGAARTYTLAGMIRYMMPYLDPGILTDAEAQHIAAYITSQPRPVYPHKDQDYLTERMPIDAVYYPEARRGK